MPDAGLELVVLHFLDAFHRHGVGEFEGRGAGGGLVVGRVGVVVVAVEEGVGFGTGGGGGLFEAGLGGERELVGAVVVAVGAAYALRDVLADLGEHRGRGDVLLDLVHGRWWWVGY